MDETSDDSLVNGTGSPSDYDMITGGAYSYNQTAFDTVDNGTTANTSTGTGSAPAANAPPANGSSYTPPGWLSSLSGLATTAGQVTTQLTPIINGKPATSPAAAGQSGANTGNAPAGALVKSSSTVLLFLAAGVAALFLFGKKSRA